MEVHQGNGSVWEFFLAILFILGNIAYIHAAVISSRNYKRWPLFRIVLWISATLIAVFTMLGPGAFQNHTNFTRHMGVHLLIGMLAPLLMVLSAPITLLLRTLSVPAARKVSRLLRSPFMRLASNPIVAALLNVGGMFVLYTTDLYSWMHEYFLLYAVIHLHLFFAGYLFTAALLYIDPVSHRFSYPYRAVVLVLSLAGHGILSKLIYASPPEGVPKTEAEAGGMLMYYGGDGIDAVLIFILCWKWYHSARPRQLATESGFK